MKRARVLGPRGRFGFTLLEMMAVILLMALGFGIALTGFSGSKARLKRAAQMVTQDFQTLYVKAIQDATIYRVSFPEDNKEVYIIERYEAPMKKPNADDREAMNKWEEHQRAIDDLSLDERKKRTLLERGQFVSVKVRELPSGVSLERVFTPRFEEGERAKSMVFLPAGEVDQALLVLQAGDLYHSLETNPLTGRVLLTKSEISEQDWKKRISGE